MGTDDVDGFQTASTITQNREQRCPACHHEGPRSQHGADATRKCPNDWCRVGLYREQALEIDRRTSR